jgi:DNA-binding response OmpR family regulator
MENLYNASQSQQKTWSHSPVGSAPTPARRSALRRLFVVEDEPASRQALQVLLQEEGFTVEVAPSGEDALARLGTYEPDALLVDFRLPGIDGVTVARHARKARSLPVVLMSGLDESNHAIAALLREPLTDHVAKPIDIDKLVAVLLRVLGSPVPRTQPNPEDKSSGSHGRR